MLRLGYLIAAVAAVSIMAPGAALAECVTYGNLVCGPSGASVSAVSGPVVRAGSVVSPETLATGDRIFARSRESAVRIGACTISVPRNSFASIVSRGDQTCVRQGRVPRRTPTLESTRPASEPALPPSAPVETTAGLGGANLALVGVGVAVVGGIAAVVINRDDGPGTSP